MAASDTEQLVVSLEARVRDFERNFQRANRTANDNWRRIERRGDQASKRIQRDMNQTSGAVLTNVRRMGAGLARAFGIGGIGAAGVVTAIQGAASSLANVRAEAERAGVSTEVFQELSYAAQQSRVSVDAVTDGIKEMQLRADEFLTTGKGSGAEAFARIGLTQEQLRTQLRDPADLLEEIIRRVQRLDRAAQIRIFDEIFGGTGGEQFVRFLRRGADGIADLRAEAHSTGNVLSDEVLTKAEEIDRRFNQIASTVGTALKGAIVSATDALIDFINALPAAFNGAEESITDGLASVENTIAGVRANIEQARQTHNVTVIAQLEDYLAELEGQQAELRRAKNMLEFQPANTRPPEAVETPPVSETPPATTGTDTGVGGAARTIVAGYAAIRQAAQQRIAELRIEQQTLGMTTAAAEAYRFEQELIAEAQREGTSLSPRQRAEIASLAQQYGALAAEIEQANTAQDGLSQGMDALRGIATDVLGGFARDLRNGVSAAEALQRALDRVIDRVLDMMINQLVTGLFGGGGGFLGGLFGFSAGGVVEAATGGYVRGPGTGTSDSIPARLSDGEYVVNARQTAQHRDLLEAINAGHVPAFAEGGLVSARGLRTPTMAATGGTAVTVAPSISINVEGGSRGEEADAELAGRIGKEVEGTVRGLVVQELRAQMRPGGMMNR